MKDDFFKFPSTKHLALLEGIDVRDDKVMTESEQTSFLNHEIVVEEKLDGANLGISFDREGNIRIQNRGSFLQTPYSGQWKKLGQWLSDRLNLLFDSLGDRYMVFGEWCYAKHSIAYNCLPDWFLGFDVYDLQKERFLSYERRNLLFSLIQIQSVPRLACGHFTLFELEKLFSISAFSDNPSEGLYLRLDQDGWLKDRAKLVRPSFIQSIEEHWLHAGIHPNKLIPETL